MSSFKTFWVVSIVGVFALVPILTLTQASAQTTTKRKADWSAPKAAKTVKAKKSAPAAAKALPKAPPETQETTPAPAIDAATVEPTPPAIQDQSQEVLDIDTAMAATIASSGPKIGYAAALSDEGVLFDANGSSPKGQEAATSRFGTFPADVSFVRTPEKAVGAGGSGSSWGAYTIKRGDTVLSSGRYISVWRREAAGWKMISELAAGRNAPPPTPAQTSNGAPPLGPLPKRPVQLGRATPAPLGIPLTVPATPAPPETPSPESTNPQPAQPPPAS